MNLRKDHLHDAMAHCEQRELSCLRSGFVNPDCLRRGSRTGASGQSVAMWCTVCNLMRIAAALFCAMFAVLHVSVMDVLAQVMMKDAAKCGTRCELQISANKLKSECAIFLRDMPEGGLDSCLCLVLVWRVQFGLLCVSARVRWTCAVITLCNLNCWMWICMFGQLCALSSVQCLFMIFGQQTC